MSSVGKEAETKPAPPPKLWGRFILAALNILYSFYGLHAFVFEVMPDAKDADPFTLSLLLMPLAMLLSGALLLTMGKKYSLRIIRVAQISAGFFQAVIFSYCAKTWLSSSSGDMVKVYASIFAVQFVVIPAFLSILTLVYLTRPSVKAVFGVKPKA